MNVKPQMHDRNNLNIIYQAFKSWSSNTSMSNIKPLENRRTISSYLIPSISYSHTSYSAFEALYKAYEQGCTRKFTEQHMKIAETMSILADNRKIRHATILLQRWWRSLNALKLFKERLFGVGYFTGVIKSPFEVDQQCIVW